MYDHASTEVEKLPSRNQALAVVTSVVAEQVGLQVEKVAEADKLIADLHCDSLDVVEIAMKIEQRYEVTMADEYFEQDRSVGGVTDYLLQLMAASRQPKVERCDLGQGGRKETRAEARVHQRCCSRCATARRKPPTR
jgi:acyl carrier protein